MNLIRDDVMVAYADGELAGEECRKLERLLEIDTDSRRVLLSLRLAALYAREAIQGVQFSGADGCLPRLQGEAPSFAIRYPPETADTTDVEHAYKRRVKRKIKTP
jgi:hypothetical protein